MSHPAVSLTSLSEDAKLLYGRGVEDHSSTLRLDRDWLDPAAPRMASYAQRREMRLDPDFAPDERLLAAVEELTAAGFAWRSHGNVLGLTRVDPDLYTVARGDGVWDVRVSRVPRPGMQSSDGALIAVLEGAELVTRDESMTRELHVKARVPGARDVEHDPAYAASISVLLPTFPRIYGSLLTVWGLAETAHLYPLGTDPALVDDRTRETLDEPVRCTSEYCSDDPHIFAPYLPPEVDLAQAVLCIEASVRHVGSQG